MNPLLDTVEPDAFLNNNGNVMSAVNMEEHKNSATWAWAVEKHWMPSKRLFSETKVEALLAECRKQTRLETLLEAAREADNWGDARKPQFGGHALLNFADELRRMAEGDDK